MYRNRNVGQPFRVAIHNLTYSNEEARIKPALTLNKFTTSDNIYYVTIHDCFSWHLD